MLTMICLLFFVSIVSLTYEGVPLATQFYVQYQNKRTDKASKELYQMFIFTEKQRLLFLITAIPLVLGGVGFYLLHHFIGFIIGAVVGFILPKVWIKQMNLKRKRDFSNQIVDALMVLSSSLKAGMSLPQAFDVLVEEMSPPIRDEFSLVVRENQMGVVLDECLSHLKQRMPVEDLDLIIAAIGIARETGGDLTEIFGNLVVTIREKKKLEERVKTLTTQGKLQGLIMSILPIGFGFFVYNMNPASFNSMLKDKIGQLLIAWCVFSEIIGILLIKKLSKVEI